MNSIASTRKAIAPVCRFLAILVAFAAPVHLAVAASTTADCDVRLLERARFFELEHLHTLSAAELRESLVALERLNSQLSQSVAQSNAQTAAAYASIPQDKFEKASYSEKMAMEAAAGVRSLLAAQDQVEEDLRLVRRFSQAVQRTLTEPGLPNPPHHVLVLDLHVTGKSDTQVMNEITSLVGHLGDGKDAQLLRFFPNASEDLLRRYGTDLHGREFGSDRAWDLFGLEATLIDMGLKADDGFYAVPHEMAGDFGKYPNGESIPYSMVQDFMRGMRALAVYDLNQFEDFHTDFFMFRHPERKPDALLAIIRPRK